MFNELESEKTGARARFSLGMGLGEYYHVIRFKTVLRLLLSVMLFELNSGIITFSARNRLSHLLSRRVL